MIPILGARTLEQLRDNLGCLEFELGEEHLKLLDEVSRIDLGFPHDFLASEMVQGLTYGSHPRIIEDSPYAQFRKP
jgi:diketogulonate reductase-like aldo/keto reductase